MHLLHEEIERNEHLASAVFALSERTQGNYAKQGLILDINPIWRIAQRIDDAGLDPEILESWPFDFRGQWPWLELLGPDGGEPRPDFRRRYDFIEFFISRSTPTPRDRIFQPFLLRLVTNPEPSDPKLVEEHAAARSDLVKAAREARVLAVVETHPKPQLLLSPGSRVSSGSGQAGTLGGYLRDRTSEQLFATTCGHVFPGGAVAFGGWTIAYLEQPIPSPPGALCTASCGHITDLDLALLVGTASAPNAAQSLAGAVWNGQFVEMVRATSRRRIYQVGGAVIEHEIGGACWRKLIQVHAPLPGFLSPAVQVARTPPPKPGDSGAWLVRNSTEWAGMIVASNALFGYALASDLVIAKANQRFNLDLVIA